MTESERIGLHIVNKCNHYKERRNELKKKEAKLDAWRRTGYLILKHNEEEVEQLKREIALLEQEVKQLEDHLYDVDW